MRTKRIPPRQPAQLRQQAVRGNVVRPGCGHGLADVGGVEEREGFFYAAEVRERVDAVLAKGEEGFVFFAVAKGLENDDP